MFISINTVINILSFYSRATEKSEVVHMTDTKDDHLKLCVV